MVQTQFHHTPDGAKIAYRIHRPASGSSAKQAVPLILIMGLSGTMIEWSPLVDELAKQRTVLIWDHRGIGESANPSDWDYNLSHDTMCDDALSLIASLGQAFTTFDALGWSMGGHILQRMLTREQATRNSRGLIDVLKRSDTTLTVRKAVLASTMTKMPRGDFDMNKMQEDAEKIEKAKRKVWMTQQLMRLQYDEETLAASEKLRAIMAWRIDLSLKEHVPQETVGLQALAIRAYRSKDPAILGRIPPSVPVLVIHGKRDRMVRYDESLPFETMIPNVRRVDLRDGPAEAQQGAYGHFFFDYFGADYWAAKIGHFLDNVEGAAGRASL